MEMLTTITKSAIITPAARGEKSGSNFRLFRRGGAAGRRPSPVVGKDCD